MPWKRNPMPSERVCARARSVIQSLGNTAHTAANQRLERTLDDSANRRIAIAEVFLATDTILNLLLNVSSGLVVNPHVIAKSLGEKLPFLASEHLMMEAVKLGSDRQDAHESIRQTSHAPARSRTGRRTRSARCSRRTRCSVRLDELLFGRRCVGRAPEQVEEFVHEVVEPLLANHASLLRMRGARPVRPDGLPSRAQPRVAQSPHTTRSAFDVLNVALVQKLATFR